MSARLEYDHTIRDVDGRTVRDRALAWLIDNGLVPSVPGQDWVGHVAHSTGFSTIVIKRILAGHRDAWLRFVQEFPVVSGEPAEESRFW